MAFEVWLLGTSPGGGDVSEVVSGTLGVGSTELEELLATVPIVVRHNLSEEDAHKIAYELRMEHLEVEVRSADPEAPAGPPPPRPIPTEIDVPRVATDDELRVAISSRPKPIAAVVGIQSTPPEGSDAKPSMVPAPLRSHAPSGAAGTISSVPPAASRPPVPLKYLAGAGGVVLVIAIVASAMSLQRAKPLNQAEQMAALAASAAACLGTSKDAEACESCCPGAAEFGDSSCDCAIPTYCPAGDGDAAACGDCCGLGMKSKLLSEGNKCICYSGVESLVRESGK